MRCKACNVVLSNRCMVNKNEEGEFIDLCEMCLEESYVDEDTPFPRSYQLEDVTEVVSVDVPDGFNLVI